MKGIIDPAAVNHELGLCMERLSFSLIGKPTSRTPAQLRFGSRGSLAVEIGGPKRGAWCSHETGAGGGPVDLIMHIRQCAFVDAISWAAAWLGGDLSVTAAPAARVRQPRSADHQAVADRTHRVELASAIWREAIEPGSTLVERYLARRGLRLPDRGPIRFHPSCPRGAGGERLPAMVALMTNPVTGAPSGIHRTYVTEAGEKAPGDAKKMLGKAGVIRLSADGYVTTGLGLTEGIENGLAVLQAVGWAPIWAAGSSGGIATFPVLAGIEALSIFADPEPAGIKAARSCTARWSEAGRETRIIPPRAGDWNDAAQTLAA